MFNSLRSFFGRIRSWFVRSEPVPPPPPQLSYNPYKEPGVNIEYNTLFCDNKELFRPAGKPAGIWKVIFTREPVIESLKAIAEDTKVETRSRLLAYNVLRNRGVINAKEVLGVVIEVAAEGSDTLAVYKDLSARYINSTGKSMVWESGAGAGSGTNEKIQSILTISQKIIGKAELWKQPRPAPPLAGEFRITFLSADGTYIGDGKLAEIKSDAVASALVAQAGEIMVAMNKRAREAKPAAAPSTNPPQKAAAAAPVNNAAAAPVSPDKVLKIMVSKSGEIRIGNKIITLREAEVRISQLASNKGTVWFYREAGKEAPPAEALEIIKLTVRYKAPVSLSSKPDFSDTIDAKGNSVPRAN